MCIVVCVVIRVTRVTGGGERQSIRQTVTAWLASLQTSSGTYSFPPPLTQKVSTFVPRVSEKFMVEI